MALESAVSWPTAIAASGSRGPLYITNRNVLPIQRSSQDASFRFGGARVQRSYTRARRLAACALRAGLLDKNFDRGLSASLESAVCRANRWETIPTEETREGALPPVSIGSNQPDASMYPENRHERRFGSACRLRRRKAVDCVFRMPATGRGHKGQPTLPARAGGAAVGVRRVYAGGDVVAAEVLDATRDLARPRTVDRQERRVRQGLVDARAGGRPAVENVHLQIVRC